MKIVYVKWFSNIFFYILKTLLHNQCFNQTIFIAGVQPPPPLMYSPQQFATPSSLYQPPAHPFVHQTTSAASAPSQYDATALSYAQPTAPLANVFAPISTYQSFPQQLQQQPPAGGSVTTPISLPGMPPIVVSATIPPQQLEGLHFSHSQPQQQQHHQH